MKKLVLHVTECMGGGVETAITKYINESDTKTTEHVVVIISGRSDNTNGDLENARIKEIVKCSSSLLITPYLLTKLFWSYRPAYVHLHSSYAGFLGRVSAIPRKNIIYTPHCYAFLIANKPIFLRGVYRFIEKILSYRTQILAPCGEYEKKLAQSLNNNTSIVVLNNAMDNLTVPQQKSTSEDTTMISMVGRLCMQKDPSFFCNVLNKVRAEFPNVSGQWIGGGDDRFFKDMLSTHNIAVTGWLQKQQAIEHLYSSDIYVHSAAWEGNPISLIEAACLGLPIFARKIGATAVFGENLCYADEEHMAREIIKFLRDKESTPNPYHLSEKVKEMNSTEVLRKQLRTLYN